MGRRICVVGPSKHFFSGLTAHTIFLANALNKDGETSVVLLRRLLPRFLYPGKEHIGKDNYLVDFTEGTPTYDGMDWNSPLSWVRAYRFLKQHRPDVIIMLWWTSSVAHMQLFLALANKARIGAKLILEMHEVVDPLEERILPIRLYSRAAGKLLTRSVDAFIVHSTWARTQVAEIYHIPEDRVFVKPIGLYKDYERKYDKDVAKKELGIGEEFVILYFGSVRKYKGVPYLVEAFSQLPESVTSNSRVIIAGEDWGEQQSLTEMVESLPHKNHMTLLLHFVPDEMITKYFSVADVVVLPYLRTSGSGVAHIAMAYGKPIITSDLETMRECLRGYPGAWFATAGDSSTIKDKLLEVYARHSTGDALSFEPPHNTWEEIARQYGELIEQLCHGS